MSQTHNQSLVHELREIIKHRGSFPPDSPCEMAFAVGKATGKAARFEGVLSFEDASVLVCLSIETIVRMLANGLHAQFQLENKPITQAQIVDMLASVAIAAMPEIAKHAAVTPADGDSSTTIREL